MVAVQGLPPSVWTSKARGPQQESSGRLTPTDSDPGLPQLIPAARPARLPPDSVNQGKSLETKGCGRTKSLRRTWLLTHCLWLGELRWEGCGGPSLAALPHLPLPAVSAHAHAPPAFSFSFPVFLFHLLSASSLSFTFPSVLPPSLPPSPLSLPPSLPSSGERPLSPCSQRTLI